ncbi:MAG TPA: SgcJ/EcaC family oxidoreductase [Streptosporangiaceae bacterium]
MTTEAQKKKEAAVLDVVKGVHEAWNNADPDAFVAEYLEDASAILPGAYMKSREEIRGAMAFSFNGPLKGTRSSDKVLDVRFLNDDAVVVISETGILVPGETEAPPERTVYATWVLARQDGKWLLAAYSNSPSVASSQS